jgi:hypothetical protein
VILVYGDESMDETRQRVCAVAGLIGTEEQWDALGWKWTRRTNGVPFHGNDCDSDQGDYETRPHWENKALYRDLTILLAKSGLAGYGQAIDLNEGLARSNTRTGPLAESGFSSGFPLERTREAYNLQPRCQRYEGKKVNRRPS